MEIRPATIIQLSNARNGQMVQIDDDVQNVVNDLHEIDPRLRVRYSEAGGYFVVYFCEDGLPNEDGGSGQLVLTAQELDQRIVQRIRRIAAADYDYAAELERSDAAAKRAKEWEWSEWAGESGERLAHAMRKDLGYDKYRAFMADRSAAA